MGVSASFYSINDLKVRFLGVSDVFFAVFYGTNAFLVWEWKYWGLLWQLGGNRTLVGTLASVCLPLGILIYLLWKADE